MKPGRDRKTDQPPELPPILQELAERLPTHRRGCVNRKLRRALSDAFAAVLPPAARSLVRVGGLASLQCGGDLRPLLTNPANGNQEKRYGDVHWDVCDLAGCRLTTKDLVQLHPLEGMLVQTVRETVSQQMQVEEHIQIAGRRVRDQWPSLPRATRQNHRSVTRDRLRVDVPKRMNPLATTQRKNARMCPATSMAEPARCRRRPEGGVIISRYTSSRPT